MATLSIIGTSPIYQWDTGRKLQVNSTMHEVHYCHSGDEIVQRKTPYTNDEGVLIVDVPDEQLQVSGTMIAYAVLIYENEGRATFTKQNFGVVARVKPDDYVYTPSEKRTWDELDDRVTALETSGGQSYTAGNGIDITDGVISVNMATAVEDANDLPVSSDAVHDYCGDIETLLSNI